MKNKRNSVFSALAVTVAQTVGVCMLCYLVLSMFDKNAEDEENIQLD